MNMGGNVVPLCAVLRCPPFNVADAPLTRRCKADLADAAAAALRRARWRRRASKRRRSCSRWTRSKPCWISARSRSWIRVAAEALMSAMGIMEERARP